MWISGGDNELAENIVHLVLAKIPDADGKLVPGTRGISLFIVPKKLVDEKGELTGERNDVALAGLNHKLGYRGITEHAAQLRRGQASGPRRRADGVGAGAIGYLVGQPGEGLRCMFHMMNEARIAVGLGATMLGYAGYEISLDYAKGAPAGPADGRRRQGRRRSRRCRSSSMPTSSACCWRRRATAKARWRWSCTARAWSTSCTPATTPRRRASHLLLEVLTPIAKSWPSEWCLEANSLAIQVLGGYGYTRDFPVEQYWRDNRLNMIHEGTHGIQALDLLGRKVVMGDGAGLTLLCETIEATIARARGVQPLAPHADALAAAVCSSSSRRRVRPGRPARPQEALANATPYLQAFGHVVVAWIWLDVANLRGRVGRRCGAARPAAPPAATSSTTSCRRSAPGCGVVERRDDTCRTMAEDWF